MRPEEEEEGEEEEEEEEAEEEDLLATSGVMEVAGVGYGIGFASVPESGHGLVPGGAESPGKGSSRGVPKLREILRNSRKDSEVRVRVTERERRGFIGPSTDDTCAVIAEVME